MKIFHVTEVLSKYVDFSMISDEVLRRASARGGIVHNAAAHYAMGAYVAPLLSGYNGYFKSFVNWFNANVEDVLLVEKRYTDNIHGFTGRVDLVCRLINNLIAVIDIKTPVIESPTWKAQTAAYAHLIKQDAVYADISLALRLHPEGKEAKAFRYDDLDESFFIFLAALTAHRNLIK